MRPSSLLVVSIAALAGGCGFDQLLVVGAGDDTAAPDDTRPDDAPPDDTGSSEPDDTQLEDDTGDPRADDTGPPPGPRSPGVGEVVISEAMIDPSAVADEAGEWVEVWSAAGEPVSLAGCTLGDLGVDDAELTPASPGALEVAPGGFLVLCASGIGAENGGIACDGTYTYETWGGGFALSNSGDEIAVRSPGGQVIDQVVYGDDVAPTGASLGLSPGAMDAGANDDVGRWCAQRSALPGGDAGTPGAANDPC